MANMDTADADACCQQMAVVDSSALVSQSQVLTAQQPPWLLLLLLSFDRRHRLWFPCREHHFLSPLLPWPRESCLSASILLPSL